MNNELVSGGLELALDPSVAIVPRFEQYFGVWAIEAQAQNALEQLVSRTNLSLHIGAHMSAEAIAAAREQEQERQRYSVENGVAVINISGTLTKYGSSLSGSGALVSYRKAVRAAANDEAVKAIAIVIDSPGGTVAGTDDLANEIGAAAAKKPTVAYVEDMAASAGYWIASQATKIYSNASGRIGSIGVYSSVVDSSARAADMRLKVHVIRSTPLKGAGQPGAEITAEQLAEFQRQIDGIHDQFVRVVAKGRKLSLATARELADARMHSASEAEKLGLIDGIKTFDSLLGELAASKRNGARAEESISPLSQEDAMSATPDTPAAPKAASLAELKAACPGASSDFILAQMEASSTVESAMRAHGAALQAALAAKDKELAEAKEQAATATAPKPGLAKPVGTQPKGNSEAAEVDGDPVATFNEMVAKAAGTNPNYQRRMNAVRLVASRNPQLYESYLLACNPGKRQQRMIAEKLEDVA